MNQKNKKLFLLAAFFGFTAVIIGAFGAHGFKNMLVDHQIDLYRLEIYNKGVQYQFYHTFVIFISLLLPVSHNKLKRLTAWFFVIGIFLFSGSLYLLALRDFINIPTSIIGPLTPIGGLFFILGWACLFLNIFKEKN